MDSSDNQSNSDEFMGDMDDDQEEIFAEDMIEVSAEMLDQLEDDETDEMMESTSSDDAALVFEKHTRSVFCGSLTKDGKLGATGGEDDKAYLWDTETGKVELECTGHKDSVIFAQFNHDDKYLATVDMSGVVKVWRVQDRSFVWEYSMGDATWVDWHEKSNVLFGGSAEGEIYMWKIPDGSCKVLQGFGCRVEVGKIMPDGTRLAVGYEDGTIRVLDVKTNTVSTTISPRDGHSATVTSIDCHPDNNLIISAAVDGKTILSTASNGKVTAILQDRTREGQQVQKDESADEPEEEMKERNNWVETVAFCQDSSLPIAAAGTLNGEIFIWDYVKHVLRNRVTQPSGITKILWQKSSPLLYSGDLEGVIRCYDARSGQIVKTFFGHSQDILDLFVCHNGKIILSTSDDSTARIFKLDS